MSETTHACTECGDVHLPPTEAEAVWPTVFDHDPVGRNGGPPFVTDRWGAWCIQCRQWHATAVPDAAEPLPPGHPDHSCMFLPDPCPTCRQRGIGAEPVGPGAGIDVERLARVLHQTAPFNHNLGEGPIRAICDSANSHQPRAQRVAELLRLASDAPRSET